MAQLLKRVQPGDVITADMWNLAVDAINEIMQSGQNTGINIAGVLPRGTPEDPIKIGTLIELAGKNFGYSLGQSSVTFVWPLGRVNVAFEKFLLGSSDSRLAFIMPPIPSLTQAGAEMTMVVDNGIANDTRTVFVMPIVITLNGYVFVNWRTDLEFNPKPNPLKASQLGQPQPAEFGFQIQTAGLTMPASFDLSANIVDATAVIPARLVGAIEFRNASDGSLIQNKRLESMGKNETRNIIVRIPEIPIAWADQSFSLEITATAGNVTNAGRHSFTVGRQVVTADDADVNQQSWMVIDPSSGDGDPQHVNGILQGKNIKLKPGWQMIVTFGVTFKNKGRYHFTVQPKAGETLNGWALDLMSTLEYVPNNDGGTVNPGTPTIASFGVTAPALDPATGKIPPGTPTNGRIVFTTQRVGAAVGNDQEYSVELL